LEAFEAENWGGKVFLTATGMSLITISLLGQKQSIRRGYESSDRGGLTDRNEICGIAFTRSSRTRRPHEKDL
jgi:hypothetical protein